MKKLILAIALTMIASLAFGAVVDKNGTDVQIKPAQAPAQESSRDDWLYNTGGSEGFIPDSQGSFDGWGEWFITTVHNNTGEDLYLTELGFPCSGPTTGEFGWLVWTAVGGPVAPAGPANTANFYGAFSPVEPDPAVNPVVYTFVDISEENIVIPDGQYFCFGYDNTGLGGQTTANGVETWAWYGGMWDPDSGWGRTAIMQVKANFDGPVAEEDVTFGQVKSLFR